MNSSYDELMALDFVAFDHVKDFRREIGRRHLADPSVELSFHYEDDTPVVDVTAMDPVLGIYSKSYPLDGMSIETFEDMGYDLWTEAFSDDFENFNLETLLED